MAEFAGKRIVITGGAGGIGVETARTMLAHGAHVVLVDIDEDRLAQARETLGTARIATWQSATRHAGGVCRGAGFRWRAGRRADPSRRACSSAIRSIRTTTACGIARSPPT